MQMSFGDSIKETWFLLNERYNEKATPVSIHWTQKAVIFYAACIASSSAC